MVRINWYHNLEALLEKGNHDLYDYSFVKREEIIDCYSKIKIKCKNCNMFFIQSIHGHLQGRGCKKCNLIRCGKDPWTFDKIMRLARIDEFDYSMINKDKVYTRRSKLDLICKKNGHHIKQSIDSHFDGNGCWNCSFGEHWSHARIMREARKGYDYSLLDKNAKYTIETKLDIICPYGHKLSQTLSDHFHRKSGCIFCSKKDHWTFDKIMRLARTDKFDYSLIDKTKEYYIHSKILLICLKCDEHFEQKIKSHFNYETGCPKCHLSRGEQLVADVLSEMNIQFTSQFRFNKSIYKYDFMFEKNNNKYLIEFDGRQHFEQVDYFHKKRTLEQDKEKDMIKNFLSFNNDCKLLRIHYSKAKKDKIIRYINLLLKNEDHIIFSHDDYRDQWDNVIGMDRTLITKNIKL